MVSLLVAGPGWFISSLSKYVTIFMPRQAFHPNNECPPAYSQVVQCCHCCFCRKDFFLFLQGIVLFQCIPASCSLTPCCEVWLQTFVTNLAIGWAEISLVILMSAAAVPTLSSRLCVFFPTQSCLCASVWTSVWRQYSHLFPHGLLPPSFGLACFQQLGRSHQSWLVRMLILTRDTLVLCIMDAKYQPVPENFILCDCAELTSLC